MNERRIILTNSRRNPTVYSLFWGLVGGSYFVLLYFALLLELQVLFTVQIVYSLIFGLYVLFHDVRNKNPFFIAVFLIGMAQIIMVIRQFPSNITATYQELFFILMGLVFCVKKMNIKMLCVSYYVVSALIAVRLWQNFFYFFFVTEDKQMNFFANSSVNYISVFLLVMIGIIYYQSRLQNKKPQIMLILVALILSFLSKSRMGMLVTILMLFVVWNKGVINIKYIFKYIIGGILALTVLYFFFGFVFEKLGVNGIDFITEKFETHSSSYQDDARFELLTGYLSGIDAVSFFTGVDISKIQIFATLDSTHNFLLYMHYHYGVIAFVIIIFILKTLCVLFIKDRFLFYVFALLLLRGFTDDAFFVRHYDVALLMYLLTPYYSQLLKTVKTT
jgi:hypothetical protein